MSLSISIWWGKKGNENKVDGVQWIMGEEKEN